MGLRSYRTELNDIQKLTFDVVTFILTTAVTWFFVVIFSIDKVQGFFPLVFVALLIAIIVASITCAICSLPPSVGAQPVRPSPVEPEILPPPMKLIGESKAKSPAHQAYDDLMKGKGP